MKNIDDQIREALRRDDAELLEHYRGDLPIHEQLIETFHGRNRWLNALAFVFTIAVLWPDLRRGLSVFPRRDDAGDDRLGDRLHVGRALRGDAEDVVLARNAEELRSPARSSASNCRSPISAGSSNRGSKRPFFNGRTVYPNRGRPFIRPCGLRAFLLNVSKRFNSGRSILACAKGALSMNRLKQAMFRELTFRNKAGTTSRC